MSGINIPITEIAFNKGYRIKDGRIFNPNGKEIKLQIPTRKDKGQYARFSVKHEGKSRRVMVHRLVAFQKFGAKMFNDGIVVRHLDGNSLNNSDDNIAIGTHSDNSMDRPKEQRQSHSAKQNQRYSAEFIESIRLAHRNGSSFRQLQKSLGISKSTLSYYLSKTAKRQTFTFREKVDSSTST